MTYIVLTNDDGIEAPGIRALAEAIRQVTDQLSVVAPAANQSMSGHKITMFQEIKIEERLVLDKFPGVAVHGSPADCIALASHGIVDWPPRLVISGINRGANMGQDVFYSGTVSAALEATIHGIPALAVSLDNQQANDIEDYRVTARLAVQIAEKLLHRNLPQFTVLNLNVPYADTVKGVRLTRQGVRIYHDELERSADGNTVKVVGEEPTGNLDELGTDLWAVHRGYASLTPLYMDLTSHTFMAELAAWDV